LSKLTVSLLLCWTILFPAVVFGEAFVPNDPYFFYNETLRPSYPGQWHLENTAKAIAGKDNAGKDAGLRPAWNLGYTGKGIVIGILDDGVEGTHEDLKDNYKKDLSRSFGGGIISDPTGPVSKSDNHGTSVAGVAAARGGNGIGGTGAAPYAGLADLRVLGDNMSAEDYLNAYLWKSGVDMKDGKLVISKKPEIHIKNHSYHRQSFWIHGDDRIAKGLNKTAENGVIHVWSAGNERGKIDEDAAKNKDLTNSNVIAVAALGSDGKFSDYSSYGANVFVTAPSSRASDTKGLGIITTDRTGADIGYNRWSEDKNPKGDQGDEFPDTNYASDFGGTSSSAPLVSGIMALGKEANPLMDVRMAKHVLVLTSARVDDGDASATGGWVKNGAGSWFNPNYGFGNVNAGKFVEKLKTVKGVSLQTSYPSPIQTVDEKIKYLDNNNAGGTSRQLTLTTTELPAALRQPLEGVEVNLNFTHTSRGDLTAGIASPYATKSSLFNATTHLAAAQKDDASVTSFGWTFLSNAFWGEDPLGGTDKTSGIWTITMGDRVSKADEELGTWHSYNLTLLMGKLLFEGTGTITQTQDIKARSLSLRNSDDLFVNPAGYTLEVSEKIHLTGGEMNVNGAVKMFRLEDDEDDGEFILDGGILSGAGAIDAPYGFYHMAGTIKPGNSIGTLTITGDYYQSPAAMLLIEVASPVSNDILAIVGSADLEGVLQTSWMGGATPAVRTRFGAFLTATGGISGQFSSLLTNITPTVVFKPKYDVPNQVYLVVERDYANQTLLSYLTPNQRAVGFMLNQVGNSATGDLDTVLGIIDALPAYGQAAGSFGQLAPKGDAAISGMALGSAAFHADNTANRLSELRAGAGGFSYSGFQYIESDLYRRGGQAPILLAANSVVATDASPAAADEKWGMFVKGSAVFGDQKNNLEQLGYNFTHTGVTLGMDYRFTSKLVAGLMAGVNTSRARLDDAGSVVKMDSVLIGAYGTYKYKRFFVDGQVGYGISKYDNLRRIVFPGLDRTATSAPRGEQLSAYTGTGYDFRSGNWGITPAISLKYTRLAVDGYTEAGADSLNLHVHGRTTSSLQAKIGGKLSYLWETTAARVTPNVHAAYVHEFSNDSQAVTAQLAQVNIPFAIQTASPQRDFAIVGAGIISDFKNGMFLYLNYDAQIGQSNYFAHGVSAGLRIQF